MRKKRNSMLLVVLLVVVALGVGYAAVANQTLTITGYAHAKANDGTFLVKFVKMSEAGTNDADAYISGSTNSTASLTGEKTATFDAIFESKGNQYFIYKIKNESPSLSAELAINVTSSDDATFKKYFEIGNVQFSSSIALTDSKYDLVSPVLNTITLKSGETCFVKVPITMSIDVKSDYGYDTDGTTLLKADTNKILVTLTATPKESK